MHIFCALRFIFSKLKHISMTHSLLQFSSLQLKYKTSKYNLVLFNRQYILYLRFHLACKTKILYGQIFSRISTHAYKCSSSNMILSPFLKYVQITQSIEDASQKKYCSVPTYGNSQILSSKANFVVRLVWNSY